MLFERHHLITLAYSLFQREFHAVADPATTLIATQTLWQNSDSWWELLIANQPDKNIKSKIDQVQKQEPCSSRDRAVILTFERV